MCTLCVAYYPQTSTPLVIAANRDENPTRPALPWEERVFDKGTIGTIVYCPLDVLGGTWIGCNNHGTFAAITNWDLNMNLHGQGMRSRGLFLLEILKLKHFHEICDLWDSMNPERYKPFNIIVANKNTTGLRVINFSCNHVKKNISIMPAGFHISTGLGLNTLCVREQFIRKELTRKFNNFSAPIDPYNLFQCMSAHNAGIGSEDSVCVHDPEHKWETRSSAGMLIVGNNWHVSHTNKAPCITPVLENWDSHILNGQCPAGPQPIPYTGNVVMKGS